MDQYDNSAGLGAGWRFLLWFGALILSMIALAVILCLAMALSGHSFLAAGGPDAEIPWWLNLSAEGIWFACLFPLTAIIAVFVEKRPTRSLGFAFHSRWAREFGAGLLIGTLLLSLVVMILSMLGVYHVSGPQESLGDAVRWACVLGAAFLGVGLCEEFLTRGYLLQTLVDGIGVPAAFILTCLIFTAAHIFNPGETVLGIVTVFAAGAMLAVVVLRTRSLWLAVGLHAAWDWSQNFLYGTPDSGITTPGGLFHTTVSRGPDWISGGGVGPEGSLVALLILVGATIYFSRARWIIPSPESNMLWNRYVIRIVPRPAPTLVNPRPVDFDLDPIRPARLNTRPVDFDLDPVSADPSPGAVHEAGEQGSS